MWPVLLCNYQNKAMNRFPLLFSASVILSFILLLSSYDAYGREYSLFSDGKSDYVIVVSSQASESEQFAATELQSCIEAIGGVRLPIVDCGQRAKGKRIIIGFNKDIKRLFFWEKKRKADDESFTYKNKRGDIVIIGGESRGTMYGVFSFLENELGCRWLAEDCTVMQRMQNYSFSSLKHSEVPAFSHRSVLYSGGRDLTFQIHSRLNEHIKNSPGKTEKQIGGSYDFLSPHSVRYLLPVSKYFNTHPEYYALIDGTRTKKNTQPCFTNPDVLKICIAEMRKNMRKYPDFYSYDISTLDNNNRCECQQCQDAIERLGSYTDLVLDFVNRAADSLKSEFPTKKIAFLAHGQTRTPPVNVIPRDNVVVRLCNGASCHVHGLESCSNEKSKQFLTYLKKWRDITRELYIWEYASDFYLYHIPFPNFYAIRDNLVTFKNTGVNGVFAEGNHYSEVSEFRALRTYVLGKLLWNPNCDLDKVVSEFMDGYYGSAAQYMRQYFDFLHSQIRDDVHMNHVASYTKAYYSDELITTSRTILDKAKAATKDKVVLHRIEMEELTVDFLKVMKHPKDAKKDGTIERVKKVMEREGIQKIGTSAGEQAFQKKLAS